MQRKKYYSFCISEEYKIYKDILKFKKQGIQTYAQWKEHILIYYCDDEQYNLNFYHFLKSKRRKIHIGVETLSILFIPFEIALIVAFLSIADNKIYGWTIWIFVIIFLLYLGYLCKIIMDSKTKEYFLDDVCQILFNETIDK